MGHSLAQTVFSCIYVLRPERTSSQALLHSYCRVIRATCRAVVSVVSDARTNEVINFNKLLVLFYSCGAKQMFLYVVCSLTV